MNGHKKDITVLVAKTILLLFRLFVIVLCSIFGIDSGLIVKEGRSVKIKDLNDWSKRKHHFACC